MVCVGFGKAVEQGLLRLFGSVDKERDGDGNDINDR